MNEKSKILVPAGTEESPEKIDLSKAFENYKIELRNSSRGMSYAIEVQGRDMEDTLNKAKNLNERLAQYKIKMEGS